MSNVNLERRIKRQAWFPEHRFFAVTAPGLEALCAAELTALGAGEVQPETGGVNFSAKLELAVAANLWLRTAGRVWLRLKDFRVRLWEDLTRQAEAVPWEVFLAPGAPLNIQVALKGSNLKHTGRIAEVVGRAAAQRLREVGLAPPVPSEPGDENAQRLQVRGNDRRASISLDMSGAHLHKRGWRAQGGLAPLREDLAAALLMLCGYDGREPLLDPMCGSGTLVIEAASLSRGLPPGRGRSFAFESWPCHREAAWNYLKRHTLEQALAAPAAPILGRDSNREAVALAQGNAELAGVGQGVDLEAGDFFTAAPPAGPGLLVMNPPYGKRLGSVRQAQDLARRIGQRLTQAYGGWRCGVVLYRPEWAEALGLSETTAITAPFGGLHVTLLFGTVPQK
ncbi:THUMP domain-containing class I SAM-dependent RNA methyltransferase [Desulfoferula mesophila]|uniref:RNA methyltransferase n=1 Tax=Desulfoferula mesophila TaxID=3058419 RepID=A0AAU9EJP0_9BACT|nr:RNA methyltransferase [Desulfoferula mesophilus]